MALSQAAEAVASGNFNAIDAASDTGIIILLQEPIEGAECADQPEPETAPLKWPKRPGISDSDMFDPEESWIDTPPEGFCLTLTALWNVLFEWIRSSSLAYIYGRKANFHEEYILGFGKIVLKDGRSSEIKETLAVCVSRALPRLVAELSLPIPVSTL
ncbi:hypothetical protein SLE2022_286230 [Rubroshorea leprosula]